MDSNQIPTGAQQVPQAPVQAAPQAQYVPTQPKPFSGSWPKLLIGLVLFGVVLVGQGIAVAIAFAISDELLVEETAYELISALFALVAIAVLGGLSWLRIDDRKVLNAIKDCWWLLLLDVALMGITIFEYASEGESLARGWFGDFIMTALLCLGIGLCEEGMFRGLINGPLLARFGKTRRSIVMCALVSSLVFGLFHVLPPDPSEMNPLGFVQMALKTIQTGICGFTWAIIATKERDLWGVSIVHGLSDFMLIVPEVMFGAMETALSTDYVSTDASEALETIGVYVITILVYLPLIVRTVKIIRSLDAPNYGPFVRPALYAAPAAAGVGPAPMRVAPVMQQAPVAPQQAWAAVPTPGVARTPAPVMPQQAPAPVAPQQAPAVPVVDPSRQDAPRSVSHGQAAPQQQVPYQPYQQGGNGTAGPPRPSGM